MKTIPFYLTRTIKQDGCLLWEGAVASDGYPILYGNIKLHREVYKYHHPDESIEGLVVRHTCDTPRCINPEHLVSGTPADNMRDRDTRGRHTLAAFSSDQIRNIRVLYASGEHSQRELADMFGVNHRTMHYIVRNKSYQWVV